MTVINQETTEAESGPTLAELDARSVTVLTRLTTWALIGLAALAFAVGAPALYEAGRDWIGLPSWLPILVPATIDLGITLLMLGSMSARSLGLRTWPTNVGVGALVLISIVVQAAHVATLGNGQLETLVGQCLAALFPATLWLAASTVERIRFSATVARVAAARVATAARPQRRRQPVASASGRPVTKAVRPAATRSTIDPAVRATAVTRVQAGESQRAVASSLGVSRGAVQRWLEDEQSTVSLAAAV